MYARAVQPLAGDEPEPAVAVTHIALPKAEAKDVLGLGGPRRVVRRGRYQQCREPAEGRGWERGRQGCGERLVVDPEPVDGGFRGSYGRQCPAVSLEHGRREAEGATPCADTASAGEEHTEGDGQAANGRPGAGDGSGPGLPGHPGVQPSRPDRSAVEQLWLRLLQSRCQLGSGSFDGELERGGPASRQG